MSVRGGQKSGFILPTIMILSLGMFVILGSSFSTILTARKSAHESYYYELARNAAQSGIVKAEACLSTTPPLLGWESQTNQVLAPGDQCERVAVVEIDCSVDSTNCLAVNSDVRTTFKVQTYDSQGTISAGSACPKFMIATGVAEIFDAEGKTTKGYEYYLRANLDDSCRVQQVF